MSIKKSIFYQQLRDLYHFLIEILLAFKRQTYGKERDLNYNTYWDSRLLAWGRPRDNMMLKLIPKEAKVLDFGCGDGAFLQVLHEAGYEDIHGVDISDTAIQKARARGRRAEKMDLNELLQNQSFRENPPDHIVFSEVVEHLPDSERYVGELLNLAKQSLLISFPNIGYLPHRLRLCCIGRFPVQWVHHPAEHLRYWTVKDFQDWLPCCFEDQSVQFTVRVQSSNGCGFLWLYRWWPNLFGNQMVVEIRKDMIKP